MYLESTSRQEGKTDWRGAAAMPREKSDWLCCLWHASCWAKEGGEGACGRKNRGEVWYLFLISPENWRFFVLFLRSVNIDRLRESYKYALVQSLHSPSQFYAEIWFGLLCFEILMKKTGTVLVFSVVLKISWWHKRVDMSACIFSFRAIYLQFGDEITPNIVANLREILFQLDFSCKERKVQIHLKPAKIDW